MHLVEDTLNVLLAKKVSFKTYLIKPRANLAILVKPLMNELEYFVLNVVQAPLPLALEIDSAHHVILDIILLV